MQRPIISRLATAVLLAALILPAFAADAVFPIASRIGLVPPDGLKASSTFIGFEDPTNNVFARVVALPGDAFSEIEKTMTNDALKKQGMTVEKRDTLKLAGGNALVAIVRQDTSAGRIRKWLVIAPVDNMTALISFEMPATTPAPYSDAAIRASLATLTARPTVPDSEQLMLLPFHVGDMAGFRLVRVVPGVAAQFTEGPKDALEAVDQPQLVIAAAPGGPGDPQGRDRFARDLLSGLPPMKDVHVTNSETMRIGGQPGHEIRAQAKDAQTGADLEIVQWLRFGTGAYLRILGIAPKESWTPAFMRFRAVRDGLEPR